MCEKERERESGALERYFQFSRHRCRCFPSVFNLRSDIMARTAEHVARIAEIIANHP